MEPREARAVLREARKWAAEGLLTPEALAIVEARYGAEAAREPEAETDGGFASAALYGVGGVLLGAAAIALVVLMDVPEAGVPWWLGGLGLAAAAAGVGISRGLRNEGLADALLVASLVAFTSATFPDTPNVEIAALLALLAPPALTALRRDRRLVPAAAAVAFYVAAGTTSFNVGGDAEAAVTVWALLAGGYFLATLGASRAMEAPWQGEVLGIGAIGIAAATLGLIFNVIQPTMEGGGELILGAVEGALLALGLVLRIRGLVLGAAAVLTVDAIVFAFDVGGLLLGVTVLLGAAVVMLWQAEFIRRFVKETGREERKEA